MYYDANKTIETKRLLLRPFVLSDAAQISKYCNNYNLYKATLNLPYPYNEDCAINWISAHEDNFNNDVSYEFAITDKNTKRLFGCVGLTNKKQHKNGELGYWIGEEIWGNGYATEASKAVIKFAFEVMGFHKVYARHFESNPASGKVMQKAGMFKEGALKDHVMKEDRFETLIYYGIINDRKI